MYSWRSFTANMDNSRTTLWDTSDQHIDTILSPLQHDTGNLETLKQTLLQHLRTSCMPKVKELFILKEAMDIRVVRRKIITSFKLLITIMQDANKSHNEIKINLVSNHEEAIAAIQEMNKQEMLLLHETNY